MELLRQEPRQIRPSEQTLIKAVGELATKPSAEGLTACTAKLVLDHPSKIGNLNAAVRIS